MKFITHTKKNVFIKKHLNVSLFFIQLNPAFWTQDQISRIFTINVSNNKVIFHVLIQLEFIHFWTILKLSNKFTQILQSNGKCVILTFQASGKLILKEQLIFTKRFSENNMILEL